MWAVLSYYVYEQTWSPGSEINQKLIYLPLRRANCIPLKLKTLFFQVKRLINKDEICILVNSKIHLDKCHLRWGKDLKSYMLNIHWRVSFFFPYLWDCTYLREGEWKVLLHVLMFRAYSHFPNFKPTVVLDVQNSITSILSVKQAILEAQLSHLLPGGDFNTTRSTPLQLSWAGDKGGGAAHWVP